MTAAQEDGFARVAAGFYRDADPLVASEALMYALQTDILPRDHGLLLMFIRMAEVYSEVDAHFRRLLIPSLDAQKQQIIKFLVDPPDQLKRGQYARSTISSPLDLDIYWSEFLVTGSLEIVRGIVAVLDWKDVTRSLIDEALLNPDSGDL